MVEPIFVSPYFLDYVLPFVLTFTLVFAILQKTKLLGDEKKQIDALVALVIGLILIATPVSQIVVLLMPFLAVSVAILFVFMLLYGFVHGGEKDVLSKNWKYALVTIVAIALVWALLVITGYWEAVYAFLFLQPSSTQVWVNGVMLVVVVGALVAVLWKSGEK